MIEVSPFLRRRKLRVSFDIDDTLIRHHSQASAEHERLPRILHRWLGEPLRCGTVALMRELRRLGCSTWIYTLSGRSRFYIRRWLLLHGIRVYGVVNDLRHRNKLAIHGFTYAPSKFLPAFGINLHVDDSDGVRMEGEVHDFRVIVVHPVMNRGRSGYWRRFCIGRAKHERSAKILNQPSVIVKNIIRLPDRPHMRMGTNLLVCRHQRGSQFSGGGDNESVSQVFVEFTGQLATF